MLEIQVQSQYSSKWRQKQRACIVTSSLKRGMYDISPTRRCSSYQPRSAGFINFGARQCQWFVSRTMMYAKHLSAHCRYHRAG
jgi:hypothetical protein